MYLLEDRLKKNIVPIAHLGVTYRTIAKDQNVFINLGINNDSVTKQMLSIITSPRYVANRNVEALKDKIKKLDCYRYLEEQFNDFNSILTNLYHSKLCRQYRHFLEGMSYDRTENKIEVMLKRFKQSAYKSFWDVSLEEEKEVEMLFVMMLEELGIIRITINCNIPQGYCNVNALSTGEKIVIKMFSFFAEITEKKRKNIIFLYDEPENSLHPQWQKEFPEMFRTIAEDVYDIKNSHFIFTTHSPHVIMRSTELEHSNVLRMQRDEDRNVYVEKIDDVPRFSFEKILLDVFGCSYYTEREIESNKSLIDEKINTNRLNVVNFSFDINDAIEELYNKLFDD